MAPSYDDLHIAAMAVNLATTLLDCVETFSFTVLYTSIAVEVTIHYSNGG